MGARSKARKRALDVLYSAELRGETPLAAYERMAGQGNGFANPYTEVVVRGVVAEQARIDALLSAHSEGWTLGRMPAVDRNVLRIGAWEIIAAQPDVPAEVAMSEAIALVRDLSTDESPTFVNGLLGAIARAVAEDDEVEAELQAEVDAHPQVEVEAEPNEPVSAEQA